MRVYIACITTFALAFALSAGPTAQGGPGGGAPGGAPGAQGGARGGGRQAAGGPDPARVVEGGGVFAPGWVGRIDAAAAANGQVLNNSKLALESGVLHVTTGPAATYWNPA